MGTLSIKLELTEPLAAYVRERAAVGGYESPEELLGDAIRAAARQDGYLPPLPASGPGSSGDDPSPQNQERLRAAIIEGLADLDAGRVTRYDEVTAAAKSRDELLRGFLRVLAQTLRDEAHLHRLWYDIRAQAMFEIAFQADVAEIDKSLEDMIWRIVSRYAELAHAAAPLSPSACYGVIDGLFQNYLLKHLSGDESAVRNLKADVKLVLKRISAA